MSFSRGLVLEVMSGNSSAHMETIERLEQRSGMLAASSRCWSGSEGSRMAAGSEGSGSERGRRLNLDGDNARTTSSKQI